MVCGRYSFLWHDSRARVRRGGPATPFDTRDRRATCSETWSDMRGGREGNTTLSTSGNGGGDGSASCTLPAELTPTLMTCNVTPAVWHQTQRIVNDGPHKCTMGEGLASPVVCRDMDSARGPRQRPGPACLANRQLIWDAGGSKTPGPATPLKGKTSRNERGRG